MNEEIELKVDLTNREVAIVLECLDKLVQNRAAAKLIVPIMDKVEAQAMQAIEKIAEERKAAKKKLEEVAPKLEGE